MTEEVEVPVVEIEDGPVEVKLDAPVEPKKDASPKNGETRGSEDEAIASLQEQVKQAKAASAQRLAEAQRQIDAERQKALAAETELRTTKRDTITTVADSLARDKEAAKRDYVAAFEAGDAAKMADAQERIALTTARLVEAEKGKLAIEEEIKSPPRVEAQPVFVDDVEKLARTLTPKSANWLRQNPRFATGQDNHKMVSAHHAALAQGYPAESDEYFAFVNSELGIGAAPERQQRRTADDRGRAPISAPVSRDVSQSPGRTRPNSIKLTPGEVAAARALDMTLPEYAKYLLELVEEGKITRAG